MAIEANMHRIDGLAEHFIYANDDLFFLEPLEVRRVSWSLPSRYPTREFAKVPAISPGNAECGLTNASAPDASSLAPWQCATCRPTVYAMGLQKAGTTFMSSSLADALQTKYTREAVYTCCHNKCLPDKCHKWKDEQDGDDHYDHWPGVDFGGDMAQYFARCGPFSLDKTGPYGVMKADDMLPYAVPFHRFVGHEHLSMRLLFLVRHPFGNIRSLQSWYISKNTSDPGRLKVEVLAGLWARAARVYLDNPHIFAAHMRYEDLMARPVETIKQVGATLFFTTGAFELPPGGEEALLEGFDIQVKPAGTYPTFFNETETAVVLDLCGTEMASLNYSVADQWTNFSKEA